MSRTIPLQVLNPRNPRPGKGAENAAKCVAEVTAGTRCYAIHYVPNPHALIREPQRSNGSAVCVIPLGIHPPATSENGHPCWASFRGASVTKNVMSFGKS